MGTRGPLIMTSWLYPLMRAFFLRKKMIITLGEVPSELQELSKPQTVWVVMIYLLKHKVRVCSRGVK